MKKLFAFLLLIFITQIAIADDIVCDASRYYSAVYEPYTYDCPSGYYLPANTLGCKPCPSDFNCPGGTFQFNPDMFQGLYFTENITTATMNNVCAANFPADIFAIYEANKHDCATGFYMPANTDGCVECPENNYCVGGTYTFSETETQGIAPCPESDPYAPAGMWDESQCGRKLYVGDDFLYVHKSPAAPAEHRLYVKFGDNVYSANATPVSENQELKMSVNAQHTLHVKIDGVEYLIHDDSVK